MLNLVVVVCRKEKAEIWELESDVAKLGFEILLLLFNKLFLFTRFVLFDECVLFIEFSD